MHLTKKKNICYERINKILIFGEIIGSSACYMRSIFYITEFFDKRQIWILDFEYRGADYYEKEHKDYI